MFKILTNNNAIADHQINKEVSKVSARTILKERVGQETLKSTDSWYRQRVDPQDAARNAKMYKRDYERTLPETLSPQTQSEMWKRAKVLKDEFTMGMLSRDELHPVKGFMENGTMKWVVDESKLQTANCSQRELAWQKKNGSKIEEYKNIMRHLDPDNPGAGDVEKWRPRMTGVR
jgi:hypothetical protein